MLQQRNLPEEKHKAQNMLSICMHITATLCSSSALCVDFCTLNTLSNRLCVAFLITQLSLDARLFFIHNLLYSICLGTAFVEEGWII